MLPRGSAVSSLMPSLICRVRVCITAFAAALGFGPATARQLALYSAIAVSAASFLFRRPPVSSFSCRSRSILRFRSSAMSVFTLSRLPASHDSNACLAIAFLRSGGNSARNLSSVLASM